MKKILPKSINNPQGFTLIELLVVVSIIAILGVIGTVVFTGVQKGSRDARRKEDINAISNAIETDFAVNNRSAYLAPTASMFAGGNIPQDPLNTGTFVYTLPTAGATYVTCAKMEAGSGGNSSDVAGTAAANGAFFCRKNQQ